MELLATRLMRLSQNWPDEGWADFIAFHLRNVYQQRNRELSISVLVSKLLMEM
jgi:hypothetical protein